MKITQLPSSRAKRLLHKTKLARVLVFLTLMPLVMAACGTAGSPTLHSVGSTSLPPTKTITQEDAKPTLHPDATLTLRTTPIIINTSTPVKDQLVVITSTPLSTQTSTEYHLVTQAKEDLTQRLSIPIDDIVLVSMEEVTWRDGSLGCPKPGMSYTQALVNGSLIVLSVDERKYRYHSGRGGAPFLCENKSDPPLPPGLGND